MKLKITFIAAAFATIFSSCSKEANFSHSGNNFGGYHKTEETVVASATAPAEEPTFVASTEIQPVLTTETVSNSIQKVIQTNNDAKRSAEKALPATATVMSKKEVKALARKIKKDAKKTGDKEKDKKTTDKSQVVALVLCVLGWFGVQRFYLGYTGIGIAQLALFITGIFLIIPLFALFVWLTVDFVRILTGGLKPKNGDYEKTL